MTTRDTAKERVQAQFGENPTKYVTSEGHARGTDLIDLVEWLNPSPTAHVLDIATGGGHVAKALSPHVEDIVVTDITAPMLQAAQDHLNGDGVRNVRYVLADAEQLPFLANTFDIVTCRTAAHHFPHPELFLQEVERVLAPGGQCLFIDNVAPDQRELANFVNLVEEIRDPSHVRCLSIVEWKHLSSGVGLEVAKERFRKKTHAFRQWVERMAPTEAHQLIVELALRNAPPQMMTYFEIQVDNDVVVSWACDEWMALMRKP